jgi:uncharacterized protein YbjT (DUF2867 family)
MDTLVVGARGGLGKLVCVELATRGHAVRTVERAAYRDADALAKAADGAGAIVNCAGASVMLGLGRGWRGYRAVDTPIGLATVDAARRTGARLVYVGVHIGHPSVLRCRYVDAHERVTVAMRDVDGVVVRATGFFSAFAGLRDLARRTGWLADIGDGSKTTNPIDDRDLASIVAEAVRGDGPREISAGGPEVMTRREIFELVRATAGRPRGVRMMRMPLWLGAASSAMMCAVHPRMGQFARFAVLLAKHDMVAPALGTRRLADYLSSSAANVAA